MASRIQDQLRPRMPTDDIGRVPMATLGGELQVGLREDDIRINFQYGPSTFDTKHTTSGTGSVGRDGANGYASTGAGVGLAQVTSRDAVRYKSGHDVFGAMTFVFAEPEANLIQRAGFLNEEDGLAVGYNGASEFGLWFIEGGNVNFIPQSGFNHDTLDGTGVGGFTLNPQFQNAYHIAWAWHGILPPALMVWGGSERGWIVAHVMDDFANKSINPHLENPFLPLTARIERTSGAGTDKRIKFGSWRAGSVSGTAKEGLSDRHFNYQRLDAPVAAAVRTVLLGLENRTTFQGKTNHIKAELHSANIVADGTKSVLFELWDAADGAFVPALGYTDRDVDNSVMRLSTTASVFTPTAGAIPKWARVLGKVDSESFELTGQGLHVYPGEQYVLTATSANTTEASYSMRVVELF